MIHAINLSKPRVIFVTPTNYKKIVSLSQKLPFVEQVILYDDGMQMENYSKAKSFNDITNRQLTDSHLDCFKCEPQNVKENVALIMCSSGTTGQYPNALIMFSFHILIVALQKIRITEGRAVNAVQSF